MLPTDEDSATKTQKKSREYWDERARQFAGTGKGYKAICSYGMPAFYNTYIHFCQHRALTPWLRIKPGEKVLDVGCGVGRWSRLLAHQGGEVTGVDLAPTMLEEARRRAEAEGVGEHCRFVESNLADLDLHEAFSLIIGVTVLQHILDPVQFQSAINRIALHLSPNGRIVLMEVAPSVAESSCDSPIFNAKTEADYLSAFHQAGLRVVAISGVDPAPFKTSFLPHYKRLPRSLAYVGLLVVTALSFPIDYFLGRRLAKQSWHKVFVLERADKLP